MKILREIEKACRNLRQVFFPYGVQEGAGDKTYGNEGHFEQNVES